MATEEVATVSHNLGRSTKASLVLPHLSQGAQTLFCLILAEWKIHVCTDSYDVIDVGESYAVYIGPCC